MDAKQALLLKTLVQMAWADRKVVEAERELLERVLTRLGAGDEERQQLLAPPQEAADLDALARELPGLVERLDLMRLLMKVAFVDETLTFEEFDLLEKVADRLGIDHDQLEYLRQEVLNPGA